MKLIFLYGPPAVGKLTVGLELQKKLDYRLFYNHLIINALAEIFGYDRPERRELVREFRKRIIEEAVKDNIDMIVTAGTSGNGIFEYYEELFDSVKKYGGDLCLVQLAADSETILNRVNNDSRKKYGKFYSKEKLEESIHKYPEMFDKYPKINHLTIDTKNVSPIEAADKIIEYYKLS
jgi:tRNA uridine 5-carbamoylmethylation protein Kti12